MLGTHSIWICLVGTRLYHVLGIRTQTCQYNNLTVTLFVLEVRGVITALLLSRVMASIVNTEAGTCTWCNEEKRKLVREPITFLKIHV